MSEEYTLVGGDTRGSVLMFCLKCNFEINRHNYSLRMMLSPSLGRHSRHGLYSSHVSSQRIEFWEIIVFSFRRTVGITDAASVESCLSSNSDSFT